MIRILTEGQKEFKAWAKDPEIIDRYLGQADKNGKRSGGWKDKINNLPKDNAEKQRLIKFADMDWCVKNITPKELVNAMNSFKTAEEKMMDTLNSGSKIIYEDENWRVRQILNYQAAKLVGATNKINDRPGKWCICGNYSGHESRGEYYFDSYLESNYSGYYHFMNKHPKNKLEDGAYMVCPKQGSDDADIWCQADYTIDSIPDLNVRINGMKFLGDAWIKDGVLLYARNSRNANLSEILEKVTKIKPLALSEYRGQTTIIIPENIEEVGKAFMLSDRGNSTLSQITWETTAPIPERAFGNCRYMRSIAIKADVESIADNAFAGCRSLTAFKVEGDFKNALEYYDRVLKPKGVELVTPEPPVDTGDDGFDF